MSNITKRRVRTLSLYPNNRGFGFAVIEEKHNLIDWGVAYATTKHKHEDCLRRIAKLIERYQPHLVVTEHPAKSPHRGARIRRLLTATQLLAKDRHIRRGRVSRAEVRLFFARLGHCTKRSIATAVAEAFPELKPRLPPERKAWMSEDSRMAFFDAIALALVRLSSSTSRRSPRTQTRSARRVGRGAGN